MKKKITCFLSAVLVLSAAGCSGNTDTKNESTAKNVLHLAKENDAVTMDSTLATDGMSFEMIAATIEGLMTTNPEGEIVPALAESYELSDDELTYTFTLKDAKWSNGDPVTANDFVYAWKDTVSDPASEYGYLYTEDGACIKGASEALGNPDKKDDLAVKAIDDKTLQVELSKKCPYFLSLMTFPPFYPVNEEFAEELGDQYALTPDNLLANGPFVLEEWTKGNSLKLTKNPDFYDADNVALEEININIVPDASTSALSFENGSSDYARLNSTLIEKYKDNEAFRSVLGSYLWYLQFNYDNPVLQNENARKAIAYAIDKTDLTQNVLKDGSIPAKGFVTEKLAVGPDGKDYRETAEAFFDEEAEDSYKLAQEYWEKAKKELGKDEITLRLLFEPSDPSKTAAEYIQAELQKLDGLTIDMVSQEKDNRLNLQRQGDFDIVLTRWGPDYADPTTYLNILLSGTTFNYGKYESKAYDEAMKKAADADTAEERWQALQDAEAIAMEDAPVAPVFQTGAADLINPKIKNLVDNPVGVPFIYKYVTIEE